jgi:hypothetical protein
MMKLRVNNFVISPDSYGAGPHQDIDNPFGAGRERLAVKQASMMTLWLMLS